MRAPGPSPSAAKLLVPRFGLDLASPTASQAPQQARPRRWWPRGPGGRARAVGSKARNGTSARGCTSFLLPPARPPRARAEAPLPRGLHSSLGHGELQGTAPASSRQSRRWCGGVVVQQPWRPRAPVARPPRRRAGPLSLELRHASPSTSPRRSPLPGTLGIYFLASPRTCKKVRRATPLPVSSTSIASLFGSSVVFWAIGACNCSHEAGSI